MNTLTIDRDGINGVDLGVIGGWQYALCDGEVYRRAICNTGDTDAWRWDASLLRVQLHAAVAAAVAALPA